MTIFDYIIIAIIGASILLAMMRGLVAELFSLGAWLIAFWCAKQYSPTVSGLLPTELSSDSLRLVGAFIFLFFFVWLATALLRVMLTSMLSSVGLGVVNRLFGAVFGLLRGLLLVTALVVGGGLSELPLHPMWRNAYFSGPFESVALSIKPWLPVVLANNLHYPE